MKKNLKISMICLTILAGFVVSGCATHTGEGALWGGALGAGTGAIIGHAVGDSGAGALIGAGAGAILGGLAGNAADAYDEGYAHGRHDEQVYEERRDSRAPGPHEPRPRYYNRHYHGPHCGHYHGPPHGYHHYHGYYWRPSFGFHFHGQYCD